MGTTPSTAALVPWWRNLGLQPNGWWCMQYGELNKKTLNHSGFIPNRELALEKIASC